MHRSENQQIRELAVTPILLNLTCWVFKEKAEFPSKRSKLYKQGLDILLKRWDESRGIKRQDDVYGKLLLPQKIKLLSQVAAITFERGDYFFEQDKIQQHIADHLHDLTDDKTDPAQLHLDSEAVLKSIEAQHGLLIERARGIYSFSHLTFQEYFTAKELVDSWSPQVLQYLVSHIIEERWHEVFLLTAEMLQNADDLVRLMKQRIDQFLLSDSKLQQFLAWLNQKSLSVEASYKPASVRAFYYAFSLECAHDLAFALALSSHTPELDLGSAFLFISDSVPNHDFNSEYRLAVALDSELGYAPVRDLVHTNDFEFAFKLRRLLPPTDIKKFMEWCGTDSQAWTEQLKAVMIEHSHISHDWQFSEQQKNALKQYYDANKLLVDCLNSDCYVTRDVREEIEETLLLPIAEIEKQKRSS